MSKAPFDPYDVLGVPKDADEKAIRRGYRRASKSTHPDALGGSPEAFERVSTALAVLSDPKRRDQYDRTGQWDDVEPDNAMAAVYSAIATAFEAIIGDPRLGAIAMQTDMAEHLRNMLSAMDEAARKEAAQIRGEIEVRKQYLGRFKSPDGQPSVVETIIQGAIRAREAQVEATERHLETFKKAKDMLAGVSFRMDEPPPFDINRLNTRPVPGDLLRSVLYNGRPMT